MSESNHQTNHVRGHNNIEKQITSYIHDNHENGICSKQELSKQIGSISEINQAIETSSQFVEWGEDNIILAEKLIIRISDRKIITKYFQKAFEKGWISPYQLLKEMKADRRLAAILREKRIDEASKLASWIKLLLPEVKGNGHFLYQAGSPIESVEKAIKETLPGKISESFLKEFLQERGYNQSDMTS
ncbi:hypothetical protein [Domibacillus robiginosus]|uniref:hypothetical protein n=1 Tax=Domibacillus robiginosus TaxID=1071054 RepID=UPI00067B99BB|nr:hypothetical protein [Domibacillus robiginosus]